MRKDMQALHKESVNTVRVFTIICKSGIKLFVPFLRIGQGNSVVDNAFAGGIMCSMDPDSGIVNSFGKTEKGQVFTKHPDTNIELLGFKLPDWEDAKKLCKNLANVVKENRCIGWDIAHTEQGWVMAEGNCRGQIGLQQIPSEIGSKYQLLDLIKDW